MKRLFTFLAAALLAVGVNAQEKALFTNGETYNNGATLTTEHTKLVLGNNRTSQPYDVKLASAKAYCADAFGQSVEVKNEDTGEMEMKTRIVYVVGQENPKDGELDGDKSSGSGYKPESGNLPQSGTYYMLTPTVAGHVCAYIVLNADKAFFVAKASDGTCLPVSELTIKADGDEPEVKDLNDEYKCAEKVNGTVEFDVVGGETYYVFCTGSKLSFGGYVFTPSGDTPPAELTETVLWEGTAIVTGWGAEPYKQPYILSDGGTELKAVNAKAGDIVRFYMTAPDNNWQVELFYGHWESMIIRWSEVPLFDEDGSDRESVIVDLANKGYAELVLTDEILEKALVAQGWGGTFLMNGDGNLTLTKVSILQEGGGPGPVPEEGEHVSLIDQFTSNWNGEETNTHNADGTVTYNGKQWGGLSAWLCDEEGNPSDWSGYTKLVFEFAEPTPAACQGFVQCAGETEDVNNTWWANAGVTKLECPFDGIDVSKVKQACLQAADNATYQITAIYLVKKASDGIGAVKVGKVQDNIRYNLSGQRVGDSYKGVVIMNGRKFIQK